jgi:hypothetical protein
LATRDGALHLPPSGPPPSQIQTSPNLVGFDPKLVVPSQPIYLQRNDSFVLAFLSNGSNVTVRVDYRFLTPEGEIKEGEFITPPFSALSEFAIPLYEAWLLSFAARVTSGSAAGQWCFLQAFLLRGTFTGTSNPVSGQIWQGFVPNFTANGWPGTPAKEITDGAGMIRSITGTAPAAGAEVTEVVPAQRRWTLLSFRTNLTTSITVANRFPGFNVDDGVNSLFSARTNVAQAASAVDNYELAPGSQFYNDLSGNFLIPYPVLTALKAGFRIRTSTTALQGTDQYSAPQYSVIEWGNWDP